MLVTKVMKTTKKDMANAAFVVYKWTLTMIGDSIVMKTGSTVKPKKVMYVDLLDWMAKAKSVVMSIQEIQMKTIIIAIIVV